MRVALRNLIVNRAYVIPQEAIFRDHDTNYVLLEENAKVKKHPIKAGKYLLDGTQLVDDGLADGLHVITNGGVRVTDGDPVTIDEVIKDTPTP